jgi:hypothetical protein
LVIDGGSAFPADLASALIDFAFFESDLRSIERSLETYEADAETDVPRAYRISRKDKAHWARFGERIEALSKLRLLLARVEPKLNHAPKSLPRAVRRVLARLRIGADVEARLEAIDGRLEACEDLYEGASDRVADFRWYHGGHLLETWIIVFLVMESLMIALDVGLQIYWHMSGQD